MKKHSRFIIKLLALIRFSWVVCILTVANLAHAQAIGNVDVIDANGVVQGWLADYSAPMVPISIHFYVDQLDNSHYAGRIEPFEQFNRPDVWQYFNWGAANHGFAFTIPNTSPNDPSVSFNLRNGAGHHVYAFGIGLNGTNSLLGGNLDTPALPNLPVSLTQPLATDGKFCITPNQAASVVWYPPGNPINGHIEGSFDHFDYWPNLNSAIRQINGGFDMIASEIGHMQGATLLKFRAAGIPVGVETPGLTQSLDGSDLGKLDFDGISPSGQNWFCSIFTICGTPPDRRNPNGAGWFRTRDDLPYTPDEILMDERLPNLLPSYDLATIFNDSIPWEQRKAQAYRDSCPSCAGFNPGVDRVTGLINDYVEYAREMKLHFAPQPAPRLSAHWVVHPGWEWGDEAWLDQLHAANPDPAQFHNAVIYVQNPRHRDTEILKRLVQAMCASGTCLDTVYMDVDYTYLTSYTIDVLRHDKAVLEANNVKFGITILDACNGGDSAGCAVDISADGSSLFKVDRPGYDPNELYEESMLNTTSFLLSKGIIDRNTKVRLASSNRRPIESNSGINENSAGSFAHTANRVINEYLNPQGYDRSWHQNGLVATYFDNNNFTGATITRRDPTVNFDWGAGSPDPAIAPTDFSVRWEGQVWAGYSETYTLYTLSDDGVRLWVNGQLLIDNWSYHAPTENSATINLLRGEKYNIKLEYFQGGGGAAMKLSWSSPSRPKEVIPEDRLFSGLGIRASYYNNLTFYGTPVTRIDPTINFDWGYGSPDPRIGPDIFSARWEGKVVPRFSGIYTFYTLADDGARLWVNGQLLVDDWNAHPPQEHSGTIHLEAGQKYDIRFDYGENVQGAVAVLLWSSSPDQPNDAYQSKEIIPQSQLYPE
jgi:hypothetical protein